MDTNISSTDTQKKYSLGMQLSGWMLVVVPVFITFMVVVALFVRLSGWEHDCIKLRFENDAAGLAHQLEKNIKGHLKALHAIKSFYASSDNVEREGFRTFVTRQLVRHPGIQALEWIPRVSNAERTACETTAHQDGYPHFQITQRAQQGTMVRTTPRKEYLRVVTA